jgi:DNA-binding NarL/FixJ family response regulator
MKSLLSKRELEVAECIAAGLKHKETGERLFICEKTVRWHANRIYRKLKVKNRYHLAWMWRNE